MYFSYQNIWKMSYPILISLLMEQLIGITDVIYLGRVSEIALGAAALGSTYFLMLFMVPFGFSVGARIIMARRNGEGAFDRIGGVFYQGCSFLLVASAVLIGISFLFSGYIVDGLVASDTVRSAMLKYINWRIWGMVPIAVLLMAQGFFVAITQTRVLTFVSVIMVMINVILNYVFIFGRLSFPRMGIAGAALASDIAEAFAVLVYVGYFLSRVDLKKYGLTTFVYKNFKILADILKISVWTMIQEFVSVSTWFLFFVAIEHMGEHELAAANIIRSVSAFPFIAVHALAATAGSITSNLIGLKRRDEVLPSCRRIMLLGVFLLGPILIIMAIGAPQFLRVFTDDQRLANMAYPVYMVMLSTFVPLLPGWILFSSVSGTGETQKALWIELAAMLFYMLYVGGAVFYLQSSLAVVWGADFVYGMFILALSAYYMQYGRWQHKKL